MSIDKIKEAFSAKETSETIEDKKVEPKQSAKELALEIEAKVQEEKKKTSVTSVSLDYPDHLLEKIKTSDRLRKAVINGKKITSVRCRNPEAKNQWSYMVHN